MCQLALFLKVAVRDLRPSGLVLYSLFFLKLFLSFTKLKVTKIRIGVKDLSITAFFVPSTKKSSRELSRE